MTSRACSAAGGSALLAQAAGGHEPEPTAASVAREVARARDAQDAELQAAADAGRVPAVTVVAARPWSSSGATSSAYHEHRKRLQLLERTYAVPKRGQGWARSLWAAGLDRDCDSSKGNVSAVESLSQRRARAAARDNVYHGVPGLDEFDDY